MTVPGGYNTDRREERDDGGGGEDAVLGEPPRVPDTVWERVLATTLGTDDPEEFDSDLAGSESDGWEGAFAESAPDSFDILPSPGDAAEASEGPDTGEHDD